jgi:drug/metabolite transporter (DMT)-like permease
VINYQIRDLGRTEEPIAIAFYFAAFGTPTAALTLPFFYTPHSSEQWIVLIAIGIVGTLAQCMLAASLRFGAVASIIVMDYTQLIWATLYGWLVGHHLPPPTTWLGAPLIVAAGLVIAWREHRGDRGAAAPRPTTRNMWLRGGLGTPSRLPQVSPRSKGPQSCSGSFCSLLR